MTENELDQIMQRVLLDAIKKIVKQKIVLFPLLIRLPDISAVS